MRVSLLCAACVQAKRSPHDCTVQVTPNETGVYEITCGAGHHSLVALAAARYEQLFETGLSAITDQYFREAVSSFSAALERFYEFCTRVLATSAGVTVEDFNAAWKHLSRQSERQLGAFLAAHLMLEKSSPRVLATKATEFRNEVIHKGRFPTQTEALNFGDNVLSVIRPTLKLLHSRHEVALFAQWEQSLHDVLRSPQLQGKIVNRHFPAMTLRNIELDETEGRDTRYYVWFLGVRHGYLSDA